MVKKGRSIPKGEFVGTKGVRSKHQLFLPALNFRYANKRIFPKYDRYSKWSIEDILKLIYSPISQEKYYKTALNFIKLLLEKEEVSKKELKKWIKNTEYSRSTLFNIIIPRMKRIGMISYSNKIYRPKSSFGKFFEKVGVEWISLLREKGIEVK